MPVGMSSFASKSLLPGREAEVLIHSISRKARVLFLRPRFPQFLIGVIMKYLILFILAFNTIFAQNEVEQITNFEGNCLNPVFSHYDLNIPMGNLSPNLFFEIHNGDSVNIACYEYNEQLMEFENLKYVTADSFINRNPDAMDFNWGEKRYIIFESNLNGNWDIMLSEKTDDGFSIPGILVGSNEDEMNATFVRFPYALDDSIRIVYQKKNSIYLLTEKDSTYKTFAMLNSTDSISYSNPTAVLIDNWPNIEIVVAAEFQKSDSTFGIATIKKNVNSNVPTDYFELPFDSCSSPNFTDMEYSLYATLSFNRKINGIDRLFAWYNYAGQYNRELYEIVSDTTVSVYDFDAYSFYLVTARRDMNFYYPYIYKIVRNDSSFIRYSADWNHESNDHPLIYSEAHCAIGPMGNWDPLISYMVWEDSADGSIQLFGIKRWDFLGDVKKVSDQIPGKIHLSQNYPNPFNPTTIIRYSIPVVALSSVEAHRLSHVTLTIYDILGNEIAEIVNEYQKPGEYEVEFDGSKLASGIYFYRLSFGSISISKKMILIK